MKPLSLLTTTILSAFAFTGCSTPDLNISASMVPGESLSGLKTYSWSAEAGSSIHDPRIKSQQTMDREVRTSVNAELASKGYTPASRGPGDFLVEYQVSVIDAVTTNSTTRNIYSENPALADGGGVISGSDGVFFYGTPLRQTTTSLANNGSIMVSVKDPATKKMIWRGNAHATINHSAPEAQRRETVREAIEGIMEEFPPAG